MMKTKSFWSNLMGWVCLMVLGVSMAACSDDEEQPIPEEDKIATIQMEYSVFLSEDWYNFFDVEVTYTGAGSEETEALTEDWLSSWEIPFSAEPAQYVFSVVATPKADMPEIDPATVYHFDYQIKAEVTGWYEDGRMADYGMSENRSREFAQGGENMEAFVQQTHTLIDLSHNPNE